MKNLTLIFIVVILLVFSLDLISLEEQSVEDQMHLFEDSVVEQPGYTETISNSSNLGNIALSLENLIDKVVDVVFSVVDKVVGIIWFYECYLILD